MTAHVCDPAGDSLSPALTAGSPDTMRLTYDRGQAVQAATVISAIVGVLFGVQVGSLGIEATGWTHSSRKSGPNGAGEARSQAADDIVRAL